MGLNKKSLKKLIRQPEKTASLGDLIYLKEDDLAVFRKKHGKGFIYYKNGEKVSDAKELDRFQKLVIPPAWEEVKIAAIEKGHLQAVGFDEKRRKQYKYHPLWTELRNQTKFFKMSAFGKVLPKIRSRVEEDLDLPEMTRRKVLALVIRLMEETHIRIGNDYYARKNKTYGLSTLRTRHVKTSEDKMKFEFTGKRGKEHSVTVRNKKLIRLINQCEEIPGWELFKFFDKSGNKQSIDSGMVNEYIHRISDDIFSAKDFRTWSASKIFFETLYETGYKKDEKENKKVILNAFDTAASGLGNTRNVIRNYYVHPHIVESYKDGSITACFDKIKDEETTDYVNLSCSEKIMLEMISDFEISL